MRELRNLVRMELYKIWGMGLSLLLYVGMMIAFSLDIRTGMTGYIVFFYLMIYVPMAYDEQSKGNYLLCTLPVNRKQIVQAKYLYALMVLIAGSVFIVGANLVAGIFLPNRQRMLSLMPVMLLIGACFVAVTVPLLICLGTIKARVWILVAYGVAIAGATGTTTFLEDAVTEGAFVFASPLPLLLIAAVILVVSYLIAVKFYEKREFTE